MRTYSAYFSTTSTVNPPIGEFTTNNPRSNWSWNINWKKIFGNRVGECRVRGNMLSQSSQGLLMRNGEVAPVTILTYGSLRANFLSNTSDTTNYLNLGLIRPVLDPTEVPVNANGVLTPFCCLEFDTTKTSGVSMVIPDYMNQSSIFNIQILDDTENLMQRVPDYQIWLYFDVDDDIPHQRNYENNPLSYF